MSLEDLPDGWSVWNEEAGGRVVLAYRPDVFDTDAFPAACLPTITVSPGAHRRPPGARDTAVWSVVLYLEPAVEAEVETRETRTAAVAAAVTLAGAFAAGDVDYRAAYQVPREAYLDRLDELLGREA
jgi:hypothetical protein